MWKLGKFFRKKKNKKKSHLQKPSETLESNSDSAYDTSTGYREKLQYSSRSKSEKHLHISQTEYEEMRIQGKYNYFN